MPTIEAQVDTLGLADLEVEKPAADQAPFIDPPLKAVKWICKRIAETEDQGLSDHEIAAQANAKLAEMGITADHANPIKPRAHVARIRRARKARLAELQSPEPPQ
jgi:hypothetical protein